MKDRKGFSLPSLSQSTSPPFCHAAAKYYSCYSNLRSGVPFVFVEAGKERLIQLLDYSSIASPQSGLFSDWSRNKRLLRTKPWLGLPVWQCDFQSRKIPRANERQYGVWRGERRERVFVSFNTNTNTIFIMRTWS